MSNTRACLCGCLLVPLLAAQVTLPGGRAITPQGDQFVTGPGPFGLALSPSGKIAVTADGGPNRYSLSIVEGATARRMDTRRKRNPPIPEDDDTDWHSVFMGLAFDGENTVYVSEGESGRIRRADLATSRDEPWMKLNQGGYRDSYTGDLAFDAARGLLFVVDQANFRLTIIDARKRTVLSSIRTGRLPFALALSPDGKSAYVTNLGMFEYRAVPGADAAHAKETGLLFPAFGFPSAEAVRGAPGRTEKGTVDVPGLGTPNSREANSLAIVDVSNPATPRLIVQIPTGLPFDGRRVLGGSSPSGVLATAATIFVSNANQDSISTVDARSHRRGPDIPLRIPGRENLRGILPIGMALSSDAHSLLVAVAGINAVGVVDVETRRTVGHIPTPWFPTAVKVAGDTVWVASTKGRGTGPNSSGQRDIRQGAISRFPLPARGDLEKLTAQVMANNHFAPGFPAAPAPPPIEHVVIIVKENRTYDEVFGDLPGRNGEPSLARWGAKVTPNHHAIAQTWAVSDNFYADSEVSVDGHHWLVGSYPNAWTESTLDASYGGQKSFRFPTTAPGRLSFAGSDSSVHPEEQLEAGALWHHLERGHVSFRNFGEGFELAGIDEGDHLEPTGARVLTNVPMPDPLYRNTSRNYPGFNMNIPDQYRATQFIEEMKTLREMPKLIFIHLPNDHTAKERPAAGYPFDASYVADNDLALGRILEYLSHTPEWRKMAILITEDDAQSGVDHVDSHRTVLLVASPYAKRNYTSHVNTSFPGLLKTAFWLLKLPPLNLYDAAAADLSDCFTTTPDATPYTATPVDAAIFDPAKARIIKG
jgi:DNA-binding beta-propeller fold protein YncE